MKVVIQRVTSASVRVNGEVVGSIGKGLLLYIGVGKNDTLEDVTYIAGKIPKLRIFPDADDKMNCSLEDVGASILAVSQFTLYGDCQKGRRPGFSDAAEPEIANRLYEDLVATWKKQGIPTETGIFQSDMLVEAVNWGPVTFVLNSEK